MAIDRHRRNVGRRRWLEQRKGGSNQKGDLAELYKGEVSEWRPAAVPTANGGIDATG